jgi:hypothetical protein
MADFVHNRHANAFGIRYPHRSHFLARRTSAVTFANAFIPPFKGKNEEVLRTFLKYFCPEERRYHGRRS